MRLARTGEGLSRPSIRKSFVYKVCRVVVSGRFTPDSSTRPRTFDRVWGSATSGGVAGSLQAPPASGAGPFTVSAAGGRTRGRGPGTGKGNRRTRYLSCKDFRLRRVTPQTPTFPAPFQVSVGADPARRRRGRREGGVHVEGRTPTGPLPRKQRHREGRQTRPDG